MIGNASDVEAKPSILTGQTTNMFKQNDVGGSLPRLESSPEETARRHLGAAFAVGPAEPARAFVTVAPAAKTAGRLHQLAMFALLGVVGVGSLYVAMPDEGHDSSKIVVMQRDDETSAQPHVHVPVAILQEALDVAPQNIFTNAPDWMVPYAEVVIGPESINDQAGLPVRWVLPDTLAHAQLVEQSVLVFQDIPAHPDEREPSLVELPTISKLSNPVLVSSQISRPSQLTPVQLRPRFVRVRLNDAETAPLIVTTVPERVEVAESQLDRDAAVTTAALIEADIEPIAISLPASRLAPSRSLRPQFAPQNRKALANWQISRRLKRAQQVPADLFTPSASEVLQARIATSEPIERPQLIEPKRRVFQRLFGGIPAQEKMTVEKFARENNG